MIGGGGHWKGAIIAKSHTGKKIIKGEKGFANR